MPNIFLSLFRYCCQATCTLSKNVSLAIDFSVADNNFAKMQFIIQFLREMEDRRESLGNFAIFLEWISRGMRLVRNATVSISRRIFRIKKPSKVVAIDEQILDSNSIVVNRQVHDQTVESSIESDFETLAISKEIRKNSKPFFKLPVDIRNRIYDHVTPGDILNLRLTNKQINQEVDLSRGVHVRLNDARPGFEWISDSGLEALTIDQFTHENPKDDLLKYPELLRHLNISGTISRANLEFLFRNSPNLERLTIEFTQFNIREQPNLFTTSASGDVLNIPDRLKMLKISSFVAAAEDSRLVLANVKSILSSTISPLIRSFTIQIILMGPDENLEEFHLAILNFIKHHSFSLKSINIQIKQLIVDSSPFASRFFRQNLDFPSWINRLKLNEFRLVLDRYMNEWKPLLDSQKSLTLLGLDQRSHNWIELSPVLVNCQKSLKSLIVRDISLKSGRSYHHLDFGLLRNCTCLGKLTLKHQECTQLFIPRISQSDLLPKSLNELSLTYFVLKPYQELAILLRIPNLQKLELGYWTESESSLAAFLNTLALLIKLDITNIKSFTFTELKRKMENRYLEIKRLKNALVGIATILSKNSERDTQLSIRRIKPTSSYSLPFSEFCD